MARNSPGCRGLHCLQSQIPGFSDRHEAGCRRAREASGLNLLSTNARTKMLTPPSKNLLVSEHRHRRSLACFGMGCGFLLMPFSSHPSGYMKVPFGILYVQPLAIIAAGLLQFS